MKTGMTTGMKNGAKKGAKKGVEERAADFVLFFTEQSGERLGRALDE